jgi:GxxExxY protein
MLGMNQQSNLEQNEEAAAARPNGARKHHEPSARADRRAHQVIGAAIEVHRTLRTGFSERTYEAALVHELTLQGIPFVCQLPLVVRYKDVPVGEYQLDLLVDEVLVVELKAAPEITPLHISQTIAYLAATDLSLGLIINFGRPTLRDNGIRRVVRT